MFICRARDFVKKPELLRLNDPQFIVISGTLNTMAMPTALHVLNAAWESAGKALVFNFLSDRCGRQAPTQVAPVRRLDAMALLDWAFTQTPVVQYRQDYLPNGHDATIAMFKQEA